MYAPAVAAVVEWNYGWCSVETYLDEQEAVDAACRMASGIAISPQVIATFGTEETAP